MLFDTQAINKQRQNLEAYDEIWVFGYGSLIYKVDFDFLDCQNAHIFGYERRFWQGSHDHRGTPENPGRVLTLIPIKSARCFGKAFRVEHHVFEHLDHREKNGYLREEMDIHLENGRVVKGLVYIGAPDNEAWLGEASTKEIAEHIATSSGPSGDNKDYVFDLANALRDHGEVDEHVFGVELNLRVIADIF